MDSRDSKSPKVFDGDKFAIWKYHMEICFEEKDIMSVVNGRVPRPPNNAPDVEKVAWQKTNTQVRCMISLSISLHVFENLANCSIAARMWLILYAFYQQKSGEYIYMV